MRFLLLHVKSLYLWCLLYMPCILRYFYRLLTLQQNKNEIDCGHSKTNQVKALLVDMRKGKEKKVKALFLGDVRLSFRACLSFTPNQELR